MVTRSPLLRIHDMLESIRGIEKALAGKTIRDYERSWLLRSAVERGIEVISEARRHLGRELKAKHKDVRWKDIAGIGNILRARLPARGRLDHLEGGRGRFSTAQGGAAGAQGVLEIDAGNGEQKNADVRHPAKPKTNARAFSNPDVTH